MLVWFFPPLFELPAVLMLSAGFGEVAREAVYGSPGTEVVMAVVLVVVVVGTVLTWRGVPGVIRTVAVGALFVSAGLTAALLVGFLTGGAYTWRCCWRIRRSPSHGSAARFSGLLQRRKGGERVGLRHCQAAPAAAEAGDGRVS